MSQQSKTHPWQTSVVARVGRHSPEFIADVISAVATASFAEVGAAYGVSRNVVCGIVDRARRAGTQVVRKHAPPSVRAAVERPRPTPKAPVNGARVPRVPRAVLRVVPVPSVPVTFNTRIGILSVRAYECRAIDDAGDCCCQAVVPGSSWCAGHRAIYLRTPARRAA